MEMGSPIMKVTREDYLKDFLFFIELSNGQYGVINLNHLAAEDKLFAQVVTSQRQRNYHFDGVTLEWENGARLPVEWASKNLVKFTSLEEDELLAELVKARAEEPRIPVDLDDLLDDQESR